MNLNYFEYINQEQIKSGQFPLEGNQSPYSFNTKQGILFKEMLARNNADEIKDFLMDNLNKWNVLENIIPLNDRKLQIIRTLTKDEFENNKTLQDILLNVLKERNPVHNQSHIKSEYDLMCFEILMVHGQDEIRKQTHELFDDLTIKPFSPKEAYQLTSNSALFRKFTEEIKKECLLQFENNQADKVQKEIMFLSESKPMFLNLNEHIINTDEIKQFIRNVDGNHLGDFLENIDNRTLKIIAGVQGRMSYHMVLGHIIDNAYHNIATRPLENGLPQNVHKCLQFIDKYKLDLINHQYIKDQFCKKINEFINYDNNKPTNTETTKKIKKPKF